MFRSVYTFIALCLAVGFLHAQTTILDFEAAPTSTSLIYFGNNALDGTTTSVVANPNPSGINTSPNVCHFIKTAGAQTWAGAYTDPNPSTAVITNGGTISMDVWMPVAGDVLLKLEQSTSGQPNWELVTTNSTPNQWVTLTWDTGQPSGAAPNQVASGDYNRVVLFFDFGNMGGSADADFYFDNLTSDGVSSTPVDVVFQVDMSTYLDTASFGAAYVSGSMNSWSGDANQLTDPDADGIYSGTLSLLPGTYEFKYTLDNWAVQEQFQPGAPCTQTTGGFTNRIFTVTAADTLTPYCWNSCDTCGATVPMYDVEFAVDMNTYADTASFTTVYVSGTMNSWSGDANPLSDPDGDNIWTGTISMFDGAYEFKYTLDNWAAQENFVGGEPCTQTTSGFTNRVFTVSGANLPMNEVCFQSCDDCVEPTCTEPISGLKALILDETRAAVAWDANPDAGFFKIQYRVKGTSAWTLVNVPNRDYQRVAWILSGLTPNTTYEYRARQQCPDLSVGPYSAIMEFTTFTTSPCEIPADSKIVYTSDPSKVRFYIDYEPASDKYDVRYRVQGTTTPIDNKIFKFGTTVLTGLTPSTDYEYRLRTNCSGTWTGYSPWMPFRTNDAAPRPAAPAAHRNALDNGSAFAMYPNPTSSELMVQFEGEQLPVLGRVFDATGAMVRQFTPNDMIERLDVSTFSKGMYYLQVVFENESVQTQRFVKQ